MVEEIDKHVCDITYSPYDEDLDTCTIRVVGGIEKLMKDFEED